MSSRGLSILEAAIKEFIRTGKPISSDELFKKYDFGVKPAMIRAELSELAKAGYLEQPHTSSGRVPTNKGYEFIANKALAEMKANLDNLKRGLFAKKFLDSHLNNLIGDVSGQLNLLSVGYRPKDKEISKQGFGSLLKQLSVENKKDLIGVVNDFEELDKRVGKMAEFVDGNLPKVFVGKSPVTKSQHLSVVADVFKDGENEMMVMVIGPKRMNYEKIIKFFRSLN
ncbi:MAG: hypothetical protein AAB885_01335 [Patescibacteria group bacterium]